MNSLNEWVKDAQYGARSLLRSPSYIVTAALTLALAIGVNTSIYSLVSLVTESDVPMGQPEELAWIAMSRQGVVGDRRLSLADYEDLRTSNQSFTALAALRRTTAVLSGTDRPERISVFEVSENLFDVWQVPMLLGRGFRSGDGRPGAPSVAVLSYGYWTERTGRSPGVIGSTIELEGQERAIVGVLPPEMEFGLLADAQVWLPLSQLATDTSRDERDLTVSGRLRPGVSPERAEADLMALADRLAEEHPTTNRGWSVYIESTEEHLLPSDVDAVLALLYVAVTLILLMACTAVANMLLARTADRSHELALRAALGSGRLRIVRILLVENLLVSIMAGLLGVAFADVILRALVAVTGSRQPIFTMAELDADVLLFSGFICLITPIGFGLLPAIRALSVSPASALRGGGRGTVRQVGRRAMTSHLVSGQVAVAMALMLLAAAAARSVTVAQSVELGYNEQGLLSAVVQLPQSDYPTEDHARRFGRDVLAQLEQASGLRQVAWVSDRPGVWDPGSGRSFFVEGRPLDGRSDLPRALVTTASAGLLEVMEIPVIRGRGFGRGDTGESTPVAIISRSAAELYWPDGDPLGERVRFATTSDTVWRTIIGIAGDSERSEDPGARPPPQVFIPFGQRPLAEMVLMVRPDGDIESAADVLREAVASVDPNVPVDDVRTMVQFRRDRASGDYALVILFASFAAFGLVMAAMGLYGVVSHYVNSRRGEFGLRMALGAERTTVRSMILVQALRSYGVGALVGFVVGSVLTQAMANRIVGVLPNDVTTQMGIAIVLALSVLAAAYVPAVRATRVSLPSSLKAH